MAIGLCRDGSLSLQIVGLDTVTSCNAILADDHADPLLLGQVVHSLRLAFDEQLAQLVAYKVGETNR